MRYPEQRRHYVYRSTTDKLADLLDDLDQAQAEVRFCEHVGGRDWVVVTRGGARGDRHLAEARGVQR